MPIKKHPFWETTNQRTILYLGILIIFLSLIAAMINRIHYQYPGNLYLPTYAPMNLLCLFLMYVGFVLMNGRDSQMAHTLKYLFILAVISVAVTLAVNAIQFTPFPKIDHQILRLETPLHINYQHMLAWVNASPHFKQALAVAYNLLPYQLTFLPVIIILAQRTAYVDEFFFLTLFSVLIGFIIYYFFPTTAPASVINSPYFTEAQRATGLKFNQIHHHIAPSTDDGGLIAFPSFHVIWGWLTLYMARCLPLLFILLLPTFLLMVASCFLLGWHYLTDILGSVMVLMVAHAAYSKKSNEKTAKNG